MQPDFNTKQGNYRKAFAAAFPHTLPVLAGYLFIGMAFGVMIQEKGYSVLWAMFMSLIIYAGSGQYLAVNFFAPGVGFAQMIFMEFMVNIRHIFYGLSLIERFEHMGKKKPYMIFSLTDETYSLYFITKTPEGVREDQFLFAIAVLDQSYWILGSGIGALLGHLLPFDAEGIDFAMTALFLVILTEQWLEGGKRSANRRSAAAGLACGLACRILFGEDRFILPAMACIMLLLVAGRRAFDRGEKGGGEMPREAEHGVTAEGGEEPGGDRSVIGESGDVGTKERKSGMEVSEESGSGRSVMGEFGDVGTEEREFGMEVSEAAGAGEQAGTEEARAAESCQEVRENAG